RGRRSVHRRPRARRAVGVLVAPAAALVALPLVAVRPPEAVAWQVAACDVGQGSALVVRSGPAAAVMVDVGPEGSAAADCLTRLGVERLDLLVLSHAHADHVGGLGPV